ncbi:MAG TPA: Lrp/AsnC family transcriptional regulator [Candidatus Fimivivens faecavium]|nr:Lrp/AsnC family transcriptional regulator [Candidatus Fimivivens faecavium]
MDTLLRLLDENARLSDGQLAKATALSKEEVANRLAEYEKSGVIKGYKAIIDWDKTDREYVSARIEVKALLQRTGYDQVAEKLAAFEEVESVYLMSGSYDIALTVSGKTFKDIALFVAYKLAPIEEIQSTSTSFVLRKYKEKGILEVKEPDERGYMR